MWPLATLRWNNGVHNYMTYMTGDIPVGAYDSTRMSNIGIGHGAIDAGAGYTYLNPQTGHEFSGVLGFTYNFANQSTQYQNGVDMHLEVGASKYVTENLLLGVAGFHALAAVVHALAWKDGVLGRMIPALRRA